MSVDWLVIGIGGATCSGKSTLAQRLKKILDDSLLVKQDDYFLPADDPRHTPVPQLNHLNWELMTSLDVASMIHDVREIIASPRSENDIRRTRRFLILEGFLLFNCRELCDLCDLRYFLDLEKEECARRRATRIYEPPDVPGYFEKVVWPEYLEARGRVRADDKLRESIVFLDGMTHQDATFRKILNDVKKYTIR